MTSERDIAGLIELVETWNVLKVHDRSFDQQDMRRFIEVMNANTRRLITLLGPTYADFYTGLFELAQHACTLTTPGAKVYADGIDRTNV